MTKLHIINIDPQHYDASYSGRKPYELMNDGVDYEVGDYALIQEFNRATQSYTGRRFFKRITYVLKEPKLLRERIVSIGLKSLSDYEIDFADDYRKMIGYEYPKEETNE